MAIADIEMSNNGLLVVWFIQSSLLIGLARFGRFSAIFHKEDNFGDLLLICFPAHHTPSEKGTQFAQTSLC